MSSKNEVLKSAQDIVSNMEDLVNDIDSLDEHDHDVWACTDCESMVDEATQERIGELDVNDLMDANYGLWQDIGEEAVNEYKERTEEVSLALEELSVRVAGLFTTLEETDVDNVIEAINLITQKVYGVREEYSPIVPEEDIVETAISSSKCSCGADHTLVDYSVKED
jgi:hypothetical protein